mgnify:CR=1 FL=1
MFQTRKDFIFVILAGIFITNAVTAELIGGKLIWFTSIKYFALTPTNKAAPNNTANIKNIFYFQIIFKDVKKGLNHPICCKSDSFFWFYTLN